MLVNRIEDNSNHTFYNSAIGVSDWIVRTSVTDSELQMTSAYQNYGYFTKIRSSRPVGFSASSYENDFKERKKTGFSGSLIHELEGIFIVKTDCETDVLFTEHYLESMRSIRILQEGGQEEYDRFVKKEKLSRVKSELTDEGISVYRKYNDFLTYRAQINCETGEWQYSDNSQIAIRLSSGVHKLNLSISIEGFWPDEDLSSFSDTGIGLLNDKARSHFLQSNEETRNEMSKQLQALLLLSRKTKLFAGGPRFFTYFGRDSLISISLLSGVVISELTVQGLRSVLERVSPIGETAHEETLGEFASLISGADRTGKIPRAILEYHMVDDDFLLPAVIRHWLELEDKEDLKQMLRQSLQKDFTGYHLMAKNLKYCISRIKEGLIPYHSRSPVGDWRDSLAFQKIRFSYELNVGLAPYFTNIYKALLEELPELKIHDKSLPDPEEIAAAQRQFIKEAEVFKVHINPSEEKDNILKWLGKMSFNDKEISVLRNRLDESLKGNTVYEFYAMALRRDKSVINIQHNDTAFSLLFGNPGASELSRMLVPFETSFPLGLRTDAGILVSNPVFCDDEKVRLELNRSHYHGLVIWPLMHNILYHGLKRQIAFYGHRNNKNLLNRMSELLVYLDNLDSVLTHFSASELLTFSPREEGDLPLAFGAGTGSTTESNPVQLWSSLGFTRKI